MEHKEERFELQKDGTTIIDWRFGGRKCLEIDKGYKQHARLILAAVNFAFKCYDHLVERWVINDR